MTDRAAWMRKNVLRLLSEADTRTRREEVEQDVAKHPANTPEERDLSLQAVVHASHRILLDTGGYERARTNEERPAADLELIWRRLVEQRRART